MSPKAAEGKVLLYLLITVAPFAIVAPALSPLLDLGRQVRRTAVTLSCIVSALFCVAMARDAHSALLYPEALGVLVLSKVYLVTKAALVPSVTASTDDLASDNAKLAVLAALAGFAVSPLAVLFLQIGATAVMILGAVVFVAATFAAVRLPRPSDAATVPPSAGSVAERDPQGRPVYGPALPATATGAGPALAVGMASPATGPAVGPGAPGVTRPAGRRTGQPGAPRDAFALHSVRRRLRLPPIAPEVLVALTAMCVIRGSVGFVTFFLAFALKRQAAATWLYGVVVLTSGLGGLAGSTLVPRLRRSLSEQMIIFSSLVLAACTGVATALVGGLWAQPLLTFIIGLTGTTAKPSFDSLVQRHVPALAQGRAFARFEARLQLVWVVAAVIAVLVAFSFVDGDVVVAVACGIAAVFYASMRHTAQHHEPVAGPEFYGDVRSVP